MSHKVEGGSVVICSVCIATYKRPQLLDQLLTSLEQQIIHDNLMLQVIVVDNDCTRSAAPVVAQHNDQKHITFRYLVQPVKNISLTRNLAVANSEGIYLLFIDDDEVAA